MIYDFSFITTSDDKDFFVYILAKTAKDLHLEAFFYTHQKHTHCLVPNVKAIADSHKAKYNLCASPIESMLSDIPYDKYILEFATMMAQNLPLSIYFYFSNLTPIAPSQEFYESINDNAASFKNLCDVFIHSLPSIIKDTESQHNIVFSDANHILTHFNTPKTYYYTPLQTHQILNPSSEKFMALNHIDDKTHKPFKDVDKTYFTEIINALIAGESIAFCTSRGTQLISLKYTTNTHTTILCDIDSLKTYFRTNSAHIDILASFEKPLTHINPKEVFENQFPMNECGLVCIGLPYDMPLAIVGALLLQRDIGYFFLSHTEEVANFDFQHSAIPRCKILSIAQNGVFVDTHISKNNTFHSIVNAHLPTENQHLVICLSTRNPSTFLIAQQQTYRLLLDINFESNPKLILEDIARSYENGSELLKNFGSHFPQLLSSTLALPPTPQPSQNLINLFDSIAFMLGINTNNKNDKNAIFNSAYHFVRERGPRIDYALLREGNNISLDYNRIVRSCLSFKCANMENEILCFGLLDSLSEFIATFIRDTLTNLSLDKVVLLGDMLSNHIFLNKTLEYMPKNIELILPKDGMIDY